eukprot:s1588_g8.t1
MRSLKRSHAGANSWLVLGLLAPMGCDPGFFQLWTVLTTFIRLLRKQPMLHEMWNYFLLHYRGKPSHGPFGKMLEVCSQVGWALHLTGFFDHDGFWVSFLDTPEDTMRSISEDAWIQLVAKQVSGRKDMADLQGLDLLCFRQQQKRLTGAQSKILQPVQDGSFLDAKTQSKFDLAKSRTCRWCDEDDTHEHRCFRCPHFAQIHAEHGDTLLMAIDQSNTLCAHLLPSRNTWWAQFKCDYLSLPKITERRQHCLDFERLDLFTDVSFWNPDLPDFSLGAWSVVCTQMDLCLARGTLSGLRQGNDRAELRAALEALDITFDF